jgi:hypothetical protein
MKMKQLLLPILFPEEISVLNAAMCDMELSICLVIIYFYSYVNSIQTNLTW